MLNIKFISKELIFLIVLFPLCHYSSNTPVWAEQQRAPKEQRQIRFEHLRQLKEVPPKISPIEGIEVENISRIMVKLEGSPYGKLVKGIDWLSQYWVWGNKTVIEIRIEIKPTIEEAQQKARTIALVTNVPIENIEKEDSIGNNCWKYFDGWSYCFARRNVVVYLVFMPFHKKKKFDSTVGSITFKVAKEVDNMIINAPSKLSSSLTENEIIKYQSEEVGSTENIDPINARIEALVEKIEDEDSSQQVRKSAMLELAKIGTKEALESLLAFLAEEENVEVRKAITLQAKKAILKFFGNAERSDITEPTPKQRQEIEKYVRELQQRIQQDKPLINATAHLEEIGVPAIPELLQIAKDKKVNEEMRSEVILVLGSIEDTVVLEPLLEILATDSSEVVRGAATTAVEDLMRKKAE